MINVMDVKSVSTSFSVVVMLSDMTKVKELEREKEMRGKLFDSPWSHQHGSVE